MKAIILIELEDEHLLIQTNDLYDRLKGYKCDLRPLPKWKINRCTAFDEDGGIVYDDEVFDWVKELVE